MSQVIERARDSDTKIYRLRDGKNLLGHEALAAGGRNRRGQRTLNYHFQGRGRISDPAGWHLGFAAEAADPRPAGGG